MRSRRQYDPVQIGLVAVCIAATLSADSNQLTERRSSSPASTQIATKRLENNPKSRAEVSAKPADPAPALALLAQAAKPEAPPLHPRIGLAAATATVTLAPTTSPTNGQAAVTSMNIMGSGFPADTIAPNQVTISLVPVSPGSGPSADATPSAITTIVGTTRRITFQIPSTIAVSSSTAYLVSVKGSTSTGIQFASGNQAALTVIPPAKLLSVSPASGLPGQTVTATVGGLFTNFVQGSTQASFGPGIAIGQVTVYSPTTVGVQLIIAAGATPGTRDVTVATGVQTATLGGAFSVTGSADPLLTAVSPNSGRQGQRNLSVVITGQNTHFLQGATQASFGSGITVSSLTVNSQTNATAILNIDSAAALGARTPTLVTNGETVSQSNAWTVTAVATCTPPPSGMVGWWAGDGDSTDLNGVHNGTPQGGVTFVPGIVGQGFSFNGSTGIVTAPATADLDLRGSVTIDAWIKPTKFAGYVPGTCSGFTEGCSVIAGRPGGYQLALQPNGRVSLGFASGGSVNVGVASTASMPLDSYSFVAGTYDAANGLLSIYINGVLDNTLPFSGAMDSATLPFQIGAFSLQGLLPGYGAYTGIIDEVELFNRALSGTELQAIFAAGSAGKCKSTPVVSSINPVLGVQGQSNLAVSIIGQNTHFAAGLTTANFGAGIAVNAVTVANSTTLTANISISGTAALGQHTVSVATSAEVESLVGGFTVNAVSIPAISSVTPNIGQQGQQSISVVISGQNTHFSQGTAVVSFGAGISINSVVITSPTTLTANISITSTATPGPRTVTATTSTEVASLIGGFNVNSASNQAPVVSAGPALTVSVPREALLSGTVSDDGVPFNGTVAIFWTQVSGPGMVTFGNPSFTFSNAAGQVNSFKTTAAFTAVGTYVLRVTASDSLLSTNSDVTVVYSCGTLAPAPSWQPIFTDNFNRPDGAVGNGWTTWWDGALNDPNIRIENGELRNAGYPNQVGGAFRALPVTLPAAFSFDFTTTVPRVQGDPGYGDGWLIAFNTQPILGPLDGLINATWHSQIDFQQYAGSRNVLRLYRSQSNSLIVDSSPNLAEPIPSQRDFAVGVPALIEGLVNADLSATIIVHYDDGQLPASTSFSFPAAVSPAGSFGPTLLLGNSSKNYGPYFIDNLSVCSQGTTASITSLSPNNGQQGQQNISVAITGQNTHFAQGVTTAAFGSGVTTTTVSVIDSTHATATLNIAATATAGATSVSVSTGSEIVSLPSGFLINAAPILSSISPNGGWQGQQGLSVAITGVNTHFAQGMTQVTFGAGITLASPLLVNSVTSATAKLNIDSAAAVGSRVVTITTGAELISLPTGFTVQLNQPPVITSMPPTGPVWENLPSSGTPPQGRDVGYNPNVYDEANDRLISFSGDWRPEPPQADIWVLANASGLNGTPTWVQLTPSSSGPGGREAASLTYVKESNRLIVCGGINGPSDCWVLTNANGLGGIPSWIRLPDMPVSYGSAAYDSATRKLMVLGPAGELLILSNADGIGTPTWSQPSTTGTLPVSRYADSVAYDPSSNKLILFGGLNRPAPASPTNLNDLWILNNANGLGGTPRWAQMSPTGGPPPGREGANFFYDPQKNEAILFGGAVLTVFDGSGNDARNDALSDLWLLRNANGVGTPQWVQFNPIGRKPIGHFYSALGRNTANGVLSMALGRWEESATYASALLFSDTWRLNLAAVGASVGNPFTYGVLATNSDGSNPTFSLTQSPSGMSISSTSGVISYVPTAAQLGTQSVTVRVDNGKGASATQDFQLLIVPPVANTLPRVLSVIPNVGQVGTAVDFTVTGQNSSFTAGQTSAFFYNGSSVPQPYASSVTVLNASTAVVHLTIPASTPTGIWNFNIGDGFEVARASGAFTVQSSPALPTITSVTPNSGQQAQQGLSIAITGQNTHFAQATSQATSQANFGAGVTVTNLSVTDTTHATAMLNIGANAIPGANTVAVTTGAEVATLASGFTVLMGSNKPPQARDDFYSVTGRETEISMAPGFQARTLANGSPFVDISSLAADGAGTLFVGDYGTAGISKIKLASKAVTTLIAGLPLNEPDQIVIGDGRQLTGRDLVVSDHNTVETETCCDGRVFRINRDTGSVSVLAKGAGGTGPVTGDPFGLAMGTGGTFGDYLYVMDFQGASPDPPVLYRVDSSDVASKFLVSPSVWTTNQIPDYIAFANGNGFGTDLYVSDQGMGGTPTIWRVKSDATVSAFVQGQSIGMPGSLRFGPGGPFGTGLYFIDSSDPMKGQLKILLPDLSVQTFATNLPPVRDLFFAPDGHSLYVGGKQQIIEIVPDTTQTTLHVSAPGVLSNDTDPAGKALVSLLVNSPTHGSATLNLNGSFDYIPSVGFSGTDSFSYKANNGSTDSNTAVVTIKIVPQSPVNQPPYVTSGPDQILSPAGTISLSGAASDDGLPAGGLLSLFWSKVSGPGILTFANPNVANTTAVFSIPGTYVVRLTATDSQLTSSADSTIVVASTSGITTLSPNFGGQGQRDFSVAITGQNTNFVNGTTTANFGSGVSVTSLTVKSPTSASALLAIDAAAAVGTRTVTLTTGTEIDALANGFTVTLGATVPSISSVSPNSGQQGQGGPVAIVGLNTHFVQGTTQVDFGSGITVSNATVSCPTCLTVQLAVASTAPAGPHNVTVTTGTEVVPLTGGFTVTTGTPILTSITPAGAAQGQTVSVAVTGQYTHFVQGTTQVSLSGTGITATSVTVTSATSLTAQVQVATTAAIGNRDFTVTTGTEAESVPAVFKVTPGVPSLLSLTPGSGLQGQTLSVAITGQFTHFVQGTTQVSLGSGIITNSVTVTDATDLTAQISIAPTAVVGTQALTVTTGTEILTSASAFAIQPATIILYSLDPGGSYQGQTLTVSMVGQGTHFVQGSTTANFGAGVAVGGAAAGASGPVTVSSPTTASANIAIDLTATPGLRTVVANTGTEQVSFVNGFSVLPLPSLSAVSPNTGLPGQQNLLISVTGQNTHFVQGTSRVTFSSDITASTVTVVDATHLTALINIPAAASAGPRQVAVSTTPEVAVLDNGFTVLGLPSITSVSPNSLLQGQQSVSISIAGLNTHFVQGTTQVNLGSGVTVSTVAVTSSTALAVQVSVDAAAVVGTRTLTVTTGSETVSLANSLTISAPASLSSVLPSSGQQGQDLSVTLTGLNTHFVQGTTQVSFGAGVMVNSISVSSLTALSAQISIGGSAATGTRSVTAVSGSETVSLASGFTVQASIPSTLTVAPSSGLQSQMLSVFITGVATHFVQSTTKARFGPGVSVGGAITGDLGPVTVVSPTSATAQLSVIGAALPGPRTVTLITGSEVDTSANAFVVNGIPVISSVTAGAAQQGQSGAVTVTGLYTHFAQGTTQVSFGAGITVGTVQVTSATSLAAQITIANTAAPGLRSVTAQTGTEVASGANLFSVLGPVTGPGPTVTFTSPSSGAEVTSPTTVTGTVTSSNLLQWILDYQATGTAGWTTFATGTVATVSGTFDPTVLLNGPATLRLTGIDTSGQSTATTLPVVVTRNLKIGNFTVSFNDLTVPVAGLPIQIVRTYDSRRKVGGDFGVGWTLGLNSVTVTTNGNLGDNWTLTSSGGVFPTYCVQETKPHTVTLSLVDGTTYLYQPVLAGQCRQLVPPSQVTMNFTPKTGTGTTPPNTGIAVVGNAPLTLSQSAAGPIQLLDQDGAVFDPDQLKATLPDGRTLGVSQQSGLQNFTDLNGNVLTITPSGITHSSGKGVTFARDGLNRIKTITDPKGNLLKYGYNGSGDLVSYTDAASNASAYTYDAIHDLLTITDPAGVQPIRNDYDTTGRLVSHTDAYGNVINYTHNTAQNQEIVTDRLGNITVNQYDANGNIVQVTDALGGVTTRTYDANGNVLQETNPLGETRRYTYDANNNRATETDPLTSTTTYVYNNRNQLLTVTDALGRVTTNTYDTKGNLLTTSDPLGNGTTSVYNASGQVATRTDANSGVTAYVYDTSGNLTKQTDALGNAINYTYDANGNKTQQSQTRTASSGTVTLITGYQYDALNRLTQTTYPDGSTTQIQYNSIGKQAATIDQLGHQTSYQYDLMGRLLQTTYADGTNESSTFDSEGRRVSSTGRGGRTTAYQYDPLGRLSKTIYADGVSTTTAYDMAGEVLSTTDALGHITQYQYDLAGRRTKVTDALGHSTAFAYDAVGNQLSMQDANSNTTRYTYDSDNRRTKATYPDTTTDLTAYDALGRTVSKTDQASLTTQYGYDKLGRLLQVTDALGQITSYTYDEVGNRLTQTDANHRTTSFGYDNLGRRTKRTLPLGMFETSGYDAAGNLTSKTDFNGKTTTYTYDLSNRLINKTPDASFAAPAITFAYTPSGQRQTMVDASGTTIYAYDLRDRLNRKATPQGTLTYSYDPAGSLLSLRSSNSNGTSVNYAYDTLNRLSTVIDNRLASGTTTYSYDAAGNLQNYTYPNGVQTAFQYNTLNRLTNLAISKAGTLASYAYQLGPAGNRTQVMELAGRQVNYTYDSLYRLTKETIAGAASNNGAIAYQYDPVGNRLARTSTVAAVPATTSGYDANDRLTSDTYDADGNTTVSGSNTYGYDFENHLASQNAGAVTIVYDGDGNRVAKTAGAVTTKFLVDDRNLTGYAQVLEEIISGTVQRIYTYGLNRISQSQASGTSFYEYDGHGNVRFLTDLAGAVTDRYDYDAFGSIVGQAGSTPNVYLYSGEQNDASLGLYYVRARYLNSNSGRFFTSDFFPGDPESPSSLHRYLYVSGNPVNRRDPTGLLSLPELTAAVTINRILSEIYLTHIVFPLIVISTELTFDRLGFEYINAALQLAADASSPLIVLAANDLYAAGNELIALGSRTIIAAKDYTDVAKSIRKLTDATKDVADSINDVYSRFGTTARLINKMYDLFKNLDRAAKDTENALDGQFSTPAIKSTVQATADAARPLFDVILKIATSGGTSGIVTQP